MKKRKRIVLVLGLLVLLVLFCWWQNNGLMVTEYEYELPAEHTALNGVRIAQISDLHNKDFYGELERLLARAKPDVVLLTGDLVDRRDTDFSTAIDFAQSAAELAPTYYAPGNHEASLSWNGKYTELSQALEQAGVCVLENETETLEINGATIRLIGLLDPAFYDTGLSGGRKILAAQLSELTQEDALNVVLGHRPTLIDLYAGGGADLVFSGHAHGGQVRLPILGGLAAPDEGFFPKYTSGVFQEGETVEVVSRGLGNSIVPLRLFNRPELVVVTLCDK